MRTPDEIVDGIMADAVKHANQGMRAVRYRLHAADFHRVEDFLGARANWLPHDPAFRPGYFNVQTPAGLVRVEPDDSLPPGESSVDLELRRLAPRPIAAAILRIEAITLELGRELAEKPRYLRGPESVLVQFTDRWIEFDAGLFKAKAWEDVVRLEIEAAFKPQRLGRHPKAGT